MSSPCPATSSCLEALALAWALAALSAVAACHAHLPAATSAGPCPADPVRMIDGRELPETLEVEFVSLDGQRCVDTADLHEAAEPCPTGDGSIVVEVQGGEHGLGRALLYGQAQVVEGLETIHPIGDNPHDAIGRMKAFFTELHLEDGSTVPVCAELYWAGTEDPVADGIPVLDPKYFGPNTTLAWGYAHVRLYWPPDMP